MGTGLKRRRKTLKEKKQETKEGRISKKLIEELNKIKVEGEGKWYY